MSDADISPRFGREGDLCSNAAVFSLDAVL